MPIGPRAPRLAPLSSSLVLVAGCVSANFVPTGAAFPAKAPDCAIEVISAGPPDRSFEELGMIEGEGSWGKASLEDMLPKLREEACLAGGDALLLHSAQRYRTSSDGVDVTTMFTFATVIRWTDAR